MRGAPPSAAQVIPRAPVRGRVEPLNARTGAPA